MPLQEDLPRYRRLWRWGGLGLGVLVAVGSGGVALDRAFPPNLSALEQVSVEVVDRHGALLRAFPLPAPEGEDGSGPVRLATSVDQVDPAYLALLIAFEDRRFYSHPGVDPLALLRAAWQWGRSGRVISGGSTLTMQVARLLEPRPRTLRSKLIEAARALQLEHHFSKDDILGFYLTLAPFGGPVEGVRAASLRLFGKEPARLTLPEAALLVALPQAPSRLRPDRHPDAALTARTKVLDRMVGAGVLSAQAVAEAQTAPIPAPHSLPFLAPHATRQAMQGRATGAQRVTTTLDQDLQAAAEGLAARSIARLDAAVGLAFLIVDHQDHGAIRAWVGSPDYFDSRRAGAVDMVRARRSPGSALKPLLYALAFEQGIAHPETVVRDAPQHFGPYAPTNFTGQYHGDVTLSEALIQSLNIPAVALLSQLGPLRFLHQLSAAGSPLHLPPGEPLPGLAVALGGGGMALFHLTQLYSGLANGGVVWPLHLETGATAPAPLPLTSPTAAWQVSEVLRRTPPPGAFGARLPAAGMAGPVAFKTGTSYGFRDAWAVGYDGRYTLGVWVGRPDGTPRPGVDGRHGAAPLLFALFDLLPPDPARRLSSAPPPEAPPVARLRTTADLPTALQRLSGPPDLLAAEGPPLTLTFPPEGATLDLLSAADGPHPLPLRADGGQPPFRWLVNGLPLPAPAFGPARTTHWQPDGPGHVTITVIDRAGTARRVSVWVE